MESDTKSVKEIFETGACSRCGGSGHYSYCQRYGTICFKCGGAGWQFTKHGQKNYNAWRAAVDAVTVRPVTDVKPGDFVKLNNNFRKYYRVESVDFTPTYSHAVMASELGQAFGVWTSYYNYTVKLDREIALMDPIFGKYLQLEFHVGTEATVRIHPGVENMPKPEDFVTQPRRRKVSAA